MGIVTGIPLALLVVIIAFAMMLVAAPDLTRSIWRLGAARQAEQARRADDRLTHPQRLGTGSGADTRT